jgi:hypothetical protein
MGSILCLTGMVGPVSAATTTDSITQNGATSTTTPPPAPNEHKVITVRQVFQRAPTVPLYPQG